MNTIRSQDVLSDCTNVLALIAATRRHELSGKERYEMNFCASHRLIRTQFPLHEKHTAHFKILTRVSAGRDSGGFTFEMRRLSEHINYYIDLIRCFRSEVAIEIILKEYLDTGIEWGAWKSMVELKHVSVTHQRITSEKWNYYSPFQFNINIRTGDETFNLADGGIVDWTQKLLSDKKERLLISGFGTELFCKSFM